MSEKRFGKRLPSSYWIDRMRDLSEENIPGAELAEESANYMKSIGMVYSEVLGWVWPQELEEAAMNKNIRGVPTFEESTAKGKRRRINHKFRSFMEDKRKEDYFRRQNRENLQSMVDSAAKSLKEIEDVPF